MPSMPTGTVPMASSNMPVTHPAMVSHTKGRPMVDNTPPKHWNRFH